MLLNRIVKIVRHTFALAHKYLRTQAIARLADAVKSQNKNKGAEKHKCAHHGNSQTHIALVRKID